MDPSLLLEPASAGLVLGGTLVMAAFRNGFGGTRNAIWHVRDLARRPFRMVEHRAALSRHVARMKTDGVIRSEPVEVEDYELTQATAQLVKHRSIDAMVAEHDRHVAERSEKRERAMAALDSAGELAPVMGLAGTLVALSQLPMAQLGDEASLMLSVSQAVLSTFYGLLLAHLVFFPLAAAIERRGAKEEAERLQLVEWLVDQLTPACPSRVASLKQDAA